MSRSRIRAHYEQLSEFERGRIIGLKEAAGPLRSSTAVRRRHSENGFATVPFEVPWLYFSARQCHTTYGASYYELSYILSNTSLASQIAGSLSNRACLGYNGKKKRSEAFDFKKLCLFCGQVADEAAETKKKKEREKYRRKISKVSTPEFKYNVLKKSRTYCDSKGELVKDRILCEFDLIAFEAKYYTLYYANFLNGLPSTEKKHRQVDKVSEAMAESFNYIENRYDSQFTLKELRDVLAGCVPVHKTIITRLQQNDPEEERLRIVEAAIAIIREDIRSSVVETKSYPLPSKLLIKENQELPENAYCISYRKSRYGSERLIDVLYSLGFAALYGNTVKFEISTAYHPQPRILSSESGTLVQYDGDNVNTNVHTLDGNNTLHVMEMIKIATPKDIH
ncbi:uncharacterized protein TNCV_3040171 [Trichonephila clavipes]|nr:uncharacterized protein TNCV_3040171 [Trichonephila clavipes]